MSGNNKNEAVRKKPSASCRSGSTNLPASAEPKHVAAQYGVYSRTLDELGEPAFMRMKQRATVEKACRNLMDSYGLDKWHLEFVDDPPDYSGLCDRETCTIYISAECLDDAEDICRHEMAHALVGGYCHHGPEWAALAWRLVGCPRGGTKSCPEPKRMSDLIGSTTYRTLLLAVLKEAKDIGVIDEEYRTLRVHGGKVYSAMDEYVFCTDYGDVLIYTLTGSCYVNAQELQPQIEAAYVVASRSERIAEEVKAANDLIDSLQGAYLRGFRRRRTPG